MEEFDKCIEELFRLSDQILLYNAGGDITLRSSNVDPFRTKVIKYKKTYTKTKSSPKHLAEFGNIYQKCKSKLNEDLDSFMLWFEKQSYKIVITEQVYFPISIVYSKCCTIARNIDESKTNEEHVGSTYPEQFVLHLLKIFKCCEDNPKLTEYITELENELGLQQGENPDPVDGLSDVVAMASDIIGDLGVPIPKGSFNVGDLKNSISKFSKDPNAKQTMKKMFGNIKLDGADKKDIPGMFTKIFEGMQKNVEELPEPLKRSMAATTENPTGELATSSK